MSDPNQSLIFDLPRNTGRSLDEWFAVLEKTDLQKHTELMNHLKQEHGVSHGFANAIVLHYRDRGSPTVGEDPVAGQYAGAKAGLRPVYDAVVQAVTAFGEDVEIAPKRTGVSLRRGKQFAVVEAASSKRVQLGVQLKGEPTTERLLTGNAMCSHKVNLTSPDDVDDDVVGWLRSAYERA